MKELTFSRRDIKPGISCYNNMKDLKDGGTRCQMITNLCDLDFLATESRK
jgi:hypothetical protein